MDISKTCAIIGRTPSNFPWDYADKSAFLNIKYLEDIMFIVELYADHLGVTDFVCCPANGVDEDFANAVLHKKSENKKIRLHLLYPIQDSYNGDTFKHADSFILDNPPQTIKETNEKLISLAKKVVITKAKGGHYPSNSALSIAKQNNVEVELLTIKSYKSAKEYADNYLIDNIPYNLRMKNRLFIEDLKKNR